MSQSQLFMTLLLSVVLLAGGVRELWRGNAVVGVVMTAVPVSFWLSRFFGQG
jgi:hypothetical protein